MYWWDVSLSRYSSVERQKVKRKEREVRDDRFIREFVFAPNKALSLTVALRLSKGRAKALQLSRPLVEL